jgi:hypothetical protein
MGGLQSVRTLWREKSCTAGNQTPAIQLTTCHYWLSYPDPSQKKKRSAKTSEMLKQVCGEDVMSRVHVSEWCE